MKTIRTPQKSVVQHSTSVLLIAATFAALAAASAFRAIEANMATWVFKNTGIENVSNLPGPEFYAYVNHPTVFRISLQCGAGILVTVILAVATLFSLSPRFSSTRLLAAALISSVGIVAVNQARIRIIGLCIETVGFKTGFPLGHYLIGSLVSMAGLGFSLYLFARLAKTPERFRLT